ncbi:MAG TPA: hypothetical protein VGC64_09700 [Pyrinomonadaceae bacterium]
MKAGAGGHALKIRLDGNQSGGVYRCGRPHAPAPKLKATSGKRLTHIWEIS